MSPNASPSTKLGELHATLTGLRDYALLALALQTGRRASELRLLSWGHLRLEGERVHVHWPKNKGKEMRDTLPAGVSAALMAWLRACYGPDHGPDLYTLAPTAPIAASLARDPKRRGRRMTRQALSDVWARRLGTSKVHATRHTFAALMERSGARVSEIQARLGHSNIATTGRYLAALTSDENPYADTLESVFGVTAASGARDTPAGGQGEEGGVTRMAERRGRATLTGGEW